MADCHCKGISFEEIKSLFDYKDGQLIWKTGRVGTKGTAAGCVHKATGYIKVKIKNKGLMAHRLIFFLHHGFLPECVDHIDGNKSNNKIENFRAATKSQNSMNQKIRSTNTSSIKGLSWHRVNKKWKVSLCKEYKIYYFGTYEDRELAELVAIEATEKLHGNFSAYKGTLNGTA